MRNRDWIVLGSIGLARLGFLAFLGSFGCSTSSKSPVPGSSILPLGNSSLPAVSLTKEEAGIRSKQVAKTSYQLWFRLDKEASLFQGRAVIQFELKPKAKEASSRLAIDFSEGILTSIKLNSTSLDPSQIEKHYDGHHLSFSLNELLPTTNRIEIAFAHPYSNSGKGLHRFMDPADGNVYLYSNFEPYDAHRMFPCFDQPDLKATYELTVEAPKDWIVVSNTLPSETTLLESHKSWAFPPSAVFSTYVFALHAGPYAKWESSAGEIPIRLFTRKSLAKYVRPDSWFKTTQEGLEFFPTEFGFAYPFGKYDQIVVPEFNAGAMENVGAVTFSEKHIFRSPPTQDQIRQRADTILHEMAHMWFGDLVTMRWWNGLWLNESFATYQASRALLKASHFSNAPQAFFSGMKEWAYWTDQLVTTHPIEVPVPDTFAAESIFDGITYGKGASSLKQLGFYIGEDDFREGLQRYFERFAYQNTTLNDFFKALEEASGKNLRHWQHSWLQTAGVNPITTEWKCELDPKKNKPRVSSFEIIQKPSTTSGVLRPHRTQIAFFRFPPGSGSHRRDGKITHTETLDVAYSQARTPVADAIGKPCPDFIFANSNDFDYVKTEFDPTSLPLILTHLSKIPDPLTRQMIWHTLWERVLDAEMSPTDYIQTAIHQLKLETDPLILSKVSRNSYQASSSKESAMGFISPQERPSIQTRWEAFVSDSFLKAKPGSDAQMIWFKALTETALSPSSVQLLRDLLGGRKKVKGFLTNLTERRWEIIRSLCRTGVPDAETLIAKELEKDKTDFGKKSATSAEVSIPLDPIKDKWGDLISKKKEEAPLSIPLLRKAMESFHLLGQEKWTENAEDLFFETLPHYASSNLTEETDYAEWMAETFFPYQCSEKSVERTKALLSKYSRLPLTVQKTLTISQQKEERCLQIRKKFAKGE